MTKIRRYTEAELAKMLDVAAECLLQAPDAEIISELKEMGEDPDVVAKEVRSVFRSAVMQHKKARLHAAEIDHKWRLEELKRKRMILPDTPAGRRNLLGRALAALAASGAGQPTMATAQYRMYSALTADEVVQQLEQMNQLGLLDGIRNEEDLE